MGRQGSSSVGRRLFLSLSLSLSLSLHGRIMTVDINNSTVPLTHSLRSISGRGAEAGSCSMAPPPQGGNAGLSQCMTASQQAQRAALTLGGGRGGAGNKSSAKRGISGKRWHFSASLPSNQGTGARGLALDLRRRKFTCCSLGQRQRTLHATPKGAWPCTLAALAPPFRLYAAPSEHICENISSGEYTQTLTP